MKTINSDRKKLISPGDVFVGPIENGDHPRRQEIIGWENLNVETQSS